MALALAFNGPILALFGFTKHPLKICAPSASRTSSLSSHIRERSICCFQCAGRSGDEIKLRWKEVKQRRSSFFTCRVQQSNATSEENEENISQATLIWRAIKLPIYFVALVPLTVGSAAAYLQTGLFSATCYFMLLVSSVLIITWLNLRWSSCLNTREKRNGQSNDYISSSELFYSSEWEIKGIKTTTSKEFQVSAFGDHKIIS